MAAGWYDALGEVGVPYFHMGGRAASLRLADLAGVGAGSRVLMIGCGTGFSACLLARERAAEVVAIDLSPAMVASAARRAAAAGTGDRTRFLIADAHRLPFRDAGFDVVLSEFVTVFLRQPEAFAEYARVVRPGGSVGLNELHRRAEAPASAVTALQDAGRTFAEAIDLPFQLPTPTEWRAWFTSAGLEDPRLERVPPGYKVREYLAATGPVALVRLLGRALRLALTDARFRRQARGLGPLKRALLRDRATRAYTGALLCIGRKPSPDDVRFAPH